MSGIKKGRFDLIYKIYRIKIDVGGLATICCIGELDEGCNPLAFWAEGIELKAIDMWE